MCAKHYENSTMLSKVTAKNVGDVFLRHTVYSLVLTRGHCYSCSLSSQCMIFDSDLI